MLGMDFTSLCQLSIQTHIIASLQDKINPLFEFFSHSSHRAVFPVVRTSVKTRIFAQRFLLGENPPQAKKWGFPGKPGGALCERKMNIHKPPPLWITLVEKPVENVENSELSTGILPFWFSTASCGKPAQEFAYPRLRFAKNRVTSPDDTSGFSSKNLKKVYKS